MTDLPGGHPLVFNALQFGQKTPEGIIDSAWTNVGRAHEVVHEHPGARWLTVAVGPAGRPTGQAFTRAVEVMHDEGLNVVAPSVDAVAAALFRFGLGQQHGVAEAK